ncbi:MAG: hypothetical protein ACRDOL_31890 [Streptosporangiaceae bacterium]
MPPPSQHHPGRDFYDAVIQARWPVPAGAVGRRYALEQAALIAARFGLPEDLQRAVADAIAHRISLTRLYELTAHWRISGSAASQP